MSAYFGKHGKAEVRKYTRHGRTKQSQKDETDINKLLARAARAGSLDHLTQYGAQYADFSTYDFESHVAKIAEGQSIFENLPAEIKREFHQSPQQFFEFVTNPVNLDRLPELLPDIANRGNYFPPVGIIKADTTAPTATAAPIPTIAMEEKPPEPAKVGASLDTPTG